MTTSLVELGALALQLPLLFHAVLVPPVHVSVANTPEYASIAAVVSGARYPMSGAPTASFQLPPFLAAPTRPSAARTGTPIASARAATNLPPASPVPTKQLHNNTRPPPVSARPIDANASASDESVDSDHWSRANRSPAG
jgi:hypothetical protein